MPEPQLGNIENIETVLDELSNTGLRIKEAVSKLTVIVNAKKSVGLTDQQIQAILGDETHKLFPDFAAVNSQFTSAKTAFLETEVIPLNASPEETV